MHYFSSTMKRRICRAVLGLFILTTPGLDAYRATAATFEAKEVSIERPALIQPTATIPQLPEVVLKAANLTIPQAQAIVTPEVPGAQNAQPAVLQTAAEMSSVGSLSNPDAPTAQVSAEAGARFDALRTAAGDSPNLSGGGGASNSDDSFYNTARQLREPGELITAVDTLKLGEKLGLSQEQTWHTIGRLSAQGKLATFSNGYSMIVDLAKADPEDAPVVEARAETLQAVALLNGSSPADHLRAISLLQRAYLKLPKDTEDPGVADMRRQVTYLRLNAALEFVRNAIDAQDEQHRDAGSTHRGLIDEAKTYFYGAYYDPRHVPIRPGSQVTELASDAVNRFDLEAFRAQKDFPLIQKGFELAKTVARKPAPEAAIAPAASVESQESSPSRALVLVGKNSSKYPAKAPIMALTGVWFPEARQGVRLSVEGKDAFITLNKAANSGGYMIASTFAEGTTKHHPTASLVKVYGLSLEGDKMTASFDVVGTVEIESVAKDKEGTLYASVSYPAVAAGDAKRMEGLASAAKHIVSQFGAKHEDIKPWMINRITSESRPEILANVMAQELPFSLKVKQALLGARSLEERLEGSVMELMGMVRNGWSSGRQGAAAGGDEELKKIETIEDLEERMQAIGMPESVRKVARKEFSRLEDMNPKDSEGQKIRAYIDWLVDVPWTKRTTDNYDLPKAKVILDRDHSGLETVKERVLEYLAVRKKTGSTKGSILCFVGPPGVGKTSIAAGIAEALGRKFVRLSLGGVHDETVLRGHGRTYLGSLPGEVIKQMKAAGTVNPLMLLDEVDKMGKSETHGDPTAALLEILDPAQNNTFRDTYMEVPYDLSQVLFIVTGNELGNIPGPLRDRMEIIEFSGYTPQEKIAIAQTHVIPEKAKVNGLSDGQVKLTDGAIRTIIEGYTREAGVRGLREKIETLLRKISAWSETRGEKIPDAVDGKDVAKYLGIPRYSLRETAENAVGLATGLAVNDYGGSTLNIEVLAVPGSGQLRIRKQMLKMTDDSAHNVYAYIKSKATELGIPMERFQKEDIEIAFTPAGDIDGPSAGTAMATAMASRLTGRAVVPGIAMTGEITLTGRVLPIGGLKQKVMAAHRMGYHTVLFPEANKKDVEDIPAEVQKEIKLISVKSFDEVLALALEPASPVPAAALAPAAQKPVWWKPWTWHWPWK